MKDLVMNMKDMYGNKEGVFSAAMKLLDRASVVRTTSKQEAMCLLAQLPLILCSERTEPVSLYPSRHICNQIEAKKYKTLEDTSWVTEYERINGNSTLCFHHYVTGEMNQKKLGNRNKCYPITLGPYSFVPFPYWITTVIKYYCHKNHGQNRILCQTNRIKPIWTSF
jgi:hypothetical protein